MKSVFFSRYTGSGHINSASALDYRSSNCVTVFQWFRIRPIPIPVPRHVSIFGALYPKLVRLFSRERVSVPYIREKRAKKNCQPSRPANFACLIVLLQRTRFGFFNLIEFYCCCCVDAFFLPSFGWFVCLAARALAAIFRNVAMEIAEWKGLKNIQI